VAWALVSKSNVERCISPDLASIINPASSARAGLDGNVRAAQLTASVKSPRST
jgi:hypothetical protein